MRVGEIGTPDRIERAGRNRERAIDRIGAAVGADDVAILRPGYRTDDRPALARAGRSPLDREFELPPGAGCEVIRIWSTRLERVIAVNPFRSRLGAPGFRPSAVALNGDGPPEQTGLITNHEITIRS